MSTVLSDSDDEDVPRRGRGPEPADKLDFFLCGINFLNKKNRVPFPELGADIVDGESSCSRLDEQLLKVANSTSCSAFHCNKRNAMQPRRLGKVRLGAICLDLPR